MGRQEIIETIKPYLDECDMEFIQNYLDAKEAYLTHPSPKTSTALHCAFSNAFFTIKQPMVRGEISRTQFDDFIELIQEGL